MKQSLPGLFRNTAAALRRSDDDLSCAMAFCLGQMIDNLRRVKEGEATIDEFFSHYVFDSERRELANSVEAKHYLCMQDEIDDEDEAA